MNNLSMTLFLLILPFVSISQAIQPKPFEYPHKVLVYDLPTSSNGINYRIYVREPLRKLENGEKASVFYFLDPLSLFVPSSIMSSNYEYFNYIPPAYYIGIGYQDEADGIAKAENRTRDYTPTKFSPPNSTHFLASNPADYVGSGGTDAFLKALREEIIPFVEEHFNVNDSDRVLIGNSLSGLAATHTLLTQSDLFDRYLIVSPSLWWDDWNYDRPERYFMKQVSSLGKDLFKKKTRVYFAVGAEEEGFGMVTDLYLLVNKLKMKRIDDLKVHLEVLDGEIHEGVFPSAFMKGIIGLYSNEEKRRPSPSPINWNK
ncbi:alpha/beta hydrolase [Maribacter algicola]|uniref:Alpha/beta hydrolase n=1 Tax=Meishania litoralis TaxID=3434685 RepID=A0ACC7LEU8_9FLAO